MENLVTLDLIPSVYRALKQEAAKTELNINQYIEDIIVQNVFNQETPNANSDNFSLVKACRDNQFTKEELGEMFFYICQQMTPIERTMAKSLLEKFDAKYEHVELVEKRAGIYEVPKQLKKKPVRELDNMEVNNEAAEDVVSEQEGELEELDSDNEEERTDSNVESEESDTIEEVDDQEDDTDIEREEEVEYDSDVDTEFDKVAEVDEEKARKGGDNLVASNGTERKTERPAGKDRKVETKKHTMPDEPKINNESDRQDGTVNNVSADDMDPDNDKPDWDEDPQEIERKSLFINDEAASKIIESAEGLSAPIKEKKAKILKYDPKEASSSAIILGPYANVKDRVKITSRQNSARQSTNFLKNMGVTSNEVNNMMKG